MVPTPGEDLRSALEAAESAVERELGLRVRLEEKRMDEGVELPEDTATMKARWMRPVNGDVEAVER